MNVKSTRGEFMSKQNKAVFAACAASLIGMANMVTMSVLAYIYQAYPEVPQSQVALILLIPSLVGIFVAFLIGPVSAVVPKKILLIFASLCVACSGGIFYFFGGNCPIGLLLLASALLGFVQGTMASVPSAIISENSTPDVREKLLGYQTAALNGGSLFMSVLGGILGATRWQNAYLVLFLAIPVLLVVLLVLPMDHPVRIEKKTASGQKIPGRVYLICAHFALMFVCFYTFGVNISTYIITEYQLGTSAQAGIVSALQTICGVIAGIVFGRIVTILKKWTVPFCCLIVTVGYVASAFLTGSLAGCIIGSVLLGFGKSFVMPYAVNQVSTVSPPSKIPTCISFLMGCMNLGMFLSNYFIGFLAGFSGEITVFSQFSVCAVLSVAAAVLAFFLYTAEKPANTQSSI